MLGFSVGFIGAGNMTSAILNGALRSQAVRPEFVYLSNPHLEKTESFRAQGVHVTTNNTEVADAADIIVLAVKPQKFDEVLPELVGHTEGKCVVSIAAGITGEYILNKLPGISLIRAMPNTPLQIGKGMTSLTRCNDVSDAFFDAVTELFRAAGETVVVTEDQINAVIALSGSSPAYFFRFANAMVQKGKELGLEEDVALKLTSLAMEGAAGMLTKSGKTAEELTRQVCSPGGTTLAALSAFDDARLDSMVAEAMVRCVCRAEELQK